MSSSFGEMSIVRAVEGLLPQAAAAALREEPGETMHPNQRETRSPQRAHSFTSTPSLMATGWVQ